MALPNRQRADVQARDGFGVLQAGLQVGHLSSSHLLQSLVEEDAYQHQSLELVTIGN